MKKLFLTLYSLFFMMLSVDIVAQIKTTFLLDDEVTWLTVKTINDFKPTQSSKQFSSFSSLPHSILSKMSGVKLHSFSLDKKVISKKGLLLTNNLFQSPDKNTIMLSNRRLKYSSLWAFASLNYLYADLVGLMDLNLLSQYQTGVVNGVEITPAFLTVAAAYMQIPLSNVFLPHIIKNENTLRWVQIISGIIATLAQGATLFVGKPAPYYVLFSAIEMGATAYITIDAIKWKTKKSNKQKPVKIF